MMRFPIFAASSGQNLTEVVGDVALRMDLLERVERDSAELFVLLPEFVRDVETDDWSLVGFRIRDFVAAPSPTTR